MSSQKSEVPNYKSDQKNPSLLPHLNFQQSTPARISTSTTMMEIKAILLVTALRAMFSRVLLDLSSEESAWSSMPRVRTSWSRWFAESQTRSEIRRCYVGQNHYYKNKVSFQNTTMAWRMPEKNALPNLLERKSRLNGNLERGLTELCSDFIANILSFHPQTFCTSYRCRGTLYCTLIPQNLSPEILRDFYIGC